MGIPETKPGLVRNQPELTPREEKREAWLKDLAEFIVEANTNTWAADAGEVATPQRPGFKELDYERGDWHLRDSYTGYFRAPGMTTVYYQGQPVWTMAYGGRGMEEGKHDIVNATFKFLKSALMQATTDLPYRGPEEFKDGEWRYKMRMEGDLAEFSGKETIYKKGKGLVFSQLFFGGVVIIRDSLAQPFYPWDWNT